MTVGITRCEFGQRCAFVTRCDHVSRNRASNNNFPETEIQPAECRSNPIAIDRVDVWPIDDGHGTDGPTHVLGLGARGTRSYCRYLAPTADDCHARKNQKGFAVRVERSATECVQVRAHRGRCNRHCSVPESGQRCEAIRTARCPSGVFANADDFMVSAAEVQGSRRTRIVEY
ncbi:unannotated protein [freshwater metagenome]|uniref:Unannotated protein n=1 Tax=freshwater metagenome TaxID=449393 RepID=A0A6J6B3V0_9ZZZZ